MNIRIHLTKWLLPIVLVVAFQAVGQDLLNDFTPLKASGKMPEIFRSETAKKIAETSRDDLTNMGLEKQEQFLNYIHYNVDEMLQSGIVLYGDPATNYVRKVADKLLEGDPKLKRKLEFYVIKSNVTNALSTHQGIIFVTLGLLAQVENEAQLAYVISHEIAHFQKSHVREAYEQRTTLDRRTTYDDRITSWSNHSKEDEFEADKEGIKLYHKAGYKSEELLGAFDVMMYSYLPFDEEPLPKTYFNSDKLFIPTTYFPEEINPILVEEDYDDTKSSHPNIRRRKEKVIEEMQVYSNWGDKENLIGEAEFLKVRSLARFESVRLDMLNCDYGDALYSIFLLEEEYPENLFLARCKAKCWLGLASFKLNGSFIKTTDRPSKVEGESHAMHYFLRSLSKLQLSAVAMRQIADMRNSYPDDQELSQVYNRMIKLVAGYSKFKLADFKRINYEEAVNRFEQSKLELLDTTNNASNENDGEELSKYDKIKKKRSAEEAISIDEEFDQNNFHLYAISDLIGDDKFKDAYRAELAIEKDRKAEEERLDAMEYRERKKELERINAVHTNKIVLVNPIFYAYYYQEDLPQESAEYTALITDILKRNAEKFNVEVRDITYHDIEKQSTDTYNQRVLVMDYLRQLATYEEVEMFPFDYSELGKLVKSYDNPYMLLVVGDYRKTKVTHTTDLTVFLIDAEKGKMVDLIDENFKKPKKVILDGYIYDAFLIIAQ